MLVVRNLQASADETAILKGFNLELQPGTTHALMGQNGSGKSTLAHVLAGHPGYEVTGGGVLLNDINLLELAPHERARAGLFLAFQYPASLPGVSISHFIRLAQQSLTPDAFDMAAYLRELRTRMKQLNLPLTFAERSVNDGFSGGEKKRIEMLQMLMLKPRVVILDEIDSGLDIDAMQVVADAVATYKQEQPDVIILVITHYQRLLNLLPADHVHIMHDGQITQCGGPELAHKLEKSGYAKLNP